MLRLARSVSQQPVLRQLARFSSFPLVSLKSGPSLQLRHYRYTKLCLSPSSSSKKASRGLAASASSEAPASSSAHGNSSNTSSPSASSSSKSSSQAPSEKPDDTPEAASSTPESAAESAAQTSSAAPAAADPRTAIPQVLSPSESPLRRLFASWQQGVVASIGAVMGIGFLLYFLYTPVKEDTVHHTAVVASEALADARLKTQAVQLSKDVVLEVLRDPKSLDAAVDVVTELLAREETKIAVSSLLQSLFEDHYTQEVTKKFVLQVVQDPWIQDQLQGITEEQVRKLLRNSDVKSALSDFLLQSAVDSLEKPQFHYEVARAIRQSAASVVNFWWN